MVDSFKMRGWVALALVIVGASLINCQSTSSTLPPPTTTTTTAATSATSDNNETATTRTNTVKNKTSSETATEPSADVALLSGNEFVDYTETPTLLVDELGAGGQAPNETSSKDELTTTTTSSPLTTTSAESNSSAETTTMAAPTAEEEAAEEEELVDENGAPRAPKFEPPKNVSQYMDYIERLFHDLRHQITDLFEPHIPQLIRTSQMVQLSGSCSYDMLRMALALRQFEPWALRMIDSSGKVPEGIFEGSFTALGSYDECLATEFSTSGGQQQQQPPTKGKYCLVNVSPFLPPKPPADRVERMFHEEANRRNYTKDDQFARLSPMFYYMKFRIGVCVPSSCLEQDMDSISGALSTSLRLNITIAHCRQRQSHPMTGHQLAGGLIFGLVVATVLAATLMDYWRRKLDQMKRRQHQIFSQLGDGLDEIEKSPKLHQFIQPAAAIVADYSHSQPQSGRERFNWRLERHWSWMSFSLLANFKLYFMPSKATRAADHTQHHKELEGNKQATTGGPCHCLGEDQLAHQRLPQIRCLDGIRVLSLCWVIVANSYITLDPRATKRLTLSREAPKALLFQAVVQASLAIETFFFLSGLLVSLSFARRLAQQRQHHEKKQQQGGSKLLRWLQFYVHRYVRMTPATMLVIAFTMFAFRYGDGPLWFEATQKAHQSCSANWWRHLLHVANFIDTRQMCFIHYWYIAADMQLFLFAPLLMLLLHKRPRWGYALATLVGLASAGSLFFTTYTRNLPPTLLFYNSDPESRREYGNTIMTKPLTHALPYMVGILVGKWLSAPTNGGHQRQSDQLEAATAAGSGDQLYHGRISYRNNRSLAMVFGMVASLVAMAEIFLPYKWNNSQLPHRLLSALYAALFRFCWSLVLAYLVVSCAHGRDKRCRAEEARRRLVASVSSSSTSGARCHCREPSKGASNNNNQAEKQQEAGVDNNNRWMEASNATNLMCVCGSGGSLVNRLLSLSVFTHLSKLSFVAYLIHLPLMSAFISQTRGLFAFSHSLVLHLALSYLVLTFLLSFLLVHIIEFPFITFERYLFAKLFQRSGRLNIGLNHGKAAAAPNGATERKRTLDEPSKDAADNLESSLGGHKNNPTDNSNSETFRISERL